MAEEVATEVTDAKAIIRVPSSSADPALRAEPDNPRPRPLCPAPPRGHSSRDQLQSGKLVPPAGPTNPLLRARGGP